jgi:undecaprenyl phosphate N,N'-diacetylbacillosamine 1-phosphate transferase
MYKRLFKRVLDFLAAVSMLLILLPVILLIAACLFLCYRCNPFFIQQRPGKDARIFNLLKFRTMNDKKGPNGQLLPDAERLTGLGKVIRKTSLDEVLQLINVIKGDMSLVGPRPLLKEYLPLYTGEQRRRHEVRPGITGWAQVNGRNTISWEKRFSYDVWYVDHISMRLDFKILFLTVAKVLKSEGISSATSATMDKFSNN